MNISQEELEYFKQLSNNCDLKVVDGNLFLKDDTPVDLLNYLINKYPDINDIHIGTTPDKKCRTGHFYIYDGNNRTNDGFMIAYKDTVIFSIDGLNFKNEELNQYIIEMNSLASDKSFTLRSKSKSTVFEKYQFRCAMTSTTLALRRIVDNSKIFVQFQFSDNPIEKTDKDPNKKSFLFHEHVIIEDSTLWYSTINKVDNENIQNIRQLYENKINDVIKSCFLNTDTINEINTIVNLKTGDFHFYKRIAFPSHKHQLILNYIFDNFDEINTPLYKSIIKDAEELVSNLLDYEATFNDKIMIKSYMNLIEMTTY